MLKDSTYSEKMAMLNGWLETIIQEIKRDVKADHLKKDSFFAKKFFSNKNPSKLTVEELAEGYKRAFKESEQAEAIGEFFANRWLLKNTDLYDFFETRLKEVCDNFDTLEEIESGHSHRIAQESIENFGAVKSYLFSVLNSVVFPKETFETLRERAEKERRESRERGECSREQKSLELMQKSYEQQIARLSDRYEKRLTGIERKYLKDTDALKKQISALQKKMQGEAV